MRSILVILGLAAACGGNDAGPRLIHGGGIGDGDIDGTLNVYVIDSDSKAPVSGAMVQVGTMAAGTTDATGLLTLKADGLKGAQDIAVKMAGYRGTAWLHADGANVTIPITKLTVTPDSATLRGTITGWDNITVAAGHAKVALITYSQSDTLGDAANNIATPANTNVCIAAVCSWSLVSRTGTLSLVAVIADRDGKGTPTDPSDDTTTIIGYATLSPITVMKGVDQSGIALAQVDAGNLQNATIDFGTPPAGLPMTQALVGIEVGTDEVVQLPTFLQTATATVLVPKPSVFPGAMTYRLTAVAQTTAAMTAQSVVLRHALAGPMLAAGMWLIPPANAAATHTGATFTPVAGAKAHNATWSDSGGVQQLEVTAFDSAATSIAIPPLVALPTTGTLTAKIGGIAADFSVTDFSLEDDKDQLTGVATQPVTVP